MRGTDLTDEQLLSARKFVSDRMIPPQSEIPPMVTIPAEKLVRLIAWYGALRFVAGRDGTGGTLEKPGELYAKAATDG